MKLVVLGDDSVFKRFYTALDDLPIPHPLIAHYIHDDVDIRKVPAFVALGTPLLSLGEVLLWATSVAEILKEIQSTSIRKIRYTNVRDIRKTYQIDNIYDRNVRNLGILQYI